LYLPLGNGNASSFGNKIPRPRDCHWAIHHRVSPLENGNASSPCIFVGNAS